MDSVDVDILSCHVAVVFDMLASPILKEFQTRYGGDGDLENLRKSMMKMKDVLNDADGKQTMSCQVKEWLDDFNDLVYDAEDVLDLYVTVRRWNNDLGKR